MGKIYKQKDSSLSKVIKRKKTAQKVRSLFQSAPDVFVITDNRGKILTANNQLEKVFGYSENEIIGKNLCFLFPERFQARHELNINSCFKNSSSQTIGSNSELFGLRKNGSEFFIEVSLNRLTVDNEETVIAIIKDTSEKKRLHDNLQLSERRYQELTNISPVGIFRTDAEGKTTYVNPKWCEISALSFEDALDYGWLNAVHPEDREKLIDGWKKSVKSLSDSMIDYRFIRNDGSIAWVMGKAVPESNLSGKITGYIGTIIDITKRKQAEEKLLREQILLRTLLDNIPDGIYVKNKSCKKIMANLADIKNMGLKNESDVIDKTDFDLFPKETAERFFLDDQTVLKTGKPLINKEEFLIDPDGNKKWLQTSKIPLYDGNGEISGLVGIGHDITEKKNVEDALKKNEYLLKVAQRVAGLGHYTLDVSSGKWESSEILDEIFGINRTFLKDIEGWLRIVHPDHRERMRIYFSNEVIGKHKRFDNEYQIIRVADGEVRWVHGIGELEFDDNNPIKMIGTIQDITGRKETEKELRESEERFRSLYENSTVGIYRTTPDGKILLANPTLVKILGFNSFDELAKVNLSKQGFETTDERIRFIERVEKEGEIKGLEFKWKNKDGNTLYIRESAKAVRDINGKTLYYDGTIEDITEHKRAEKNVIIMSKAIIQSPVSIIITDAEGIIEYVNPMFTKVTGYSAEEVIGGDPGILNSGYHSKEFYANLWNTILSGKDFSCEMYNKKKNGELFWENVIISSIVDEKGNITHFVAVKEDITEKKNTIQELIVAKEKAEEMNRLKSNFLANMSHELRTPLVGIIGYSEFLCKDLTDPGLKEMSEAIYDSSKKLTETLNLILDLSKIESDKLELIPEKFEMITASLEIVNSFKEFANKKGVYLKSEFESPKLFANLDIRAFRSILSNLVNNAIKFTNTGGVTVNLSPDKVNGKDFVVIKVIDTGIGISKENHNHVFEDFRQVSEGLDRNFQGSGLGLSITKKFVEKLNGTINIYSELGKGSTFTVRLPLSSEGVKSIEAESNKENKSMHFDSVASILIVDDDENINNIIRNYLPSKLDVTYTKDAYDAFKFAGKKKFDVIFMDINLKKDLDGKQAAQEIRKIKGYENTPIVACTAYALKGDKEEFLSAGCTHYLSKPFSKEEILSLIDEILAPNQ